LKVKEFRSSRVGEKRKKEFNAEGRTRRRGRREEEEF
jgi:hypothetical protein